MQFDMRFTYTIKRLENIILNLNKFRNVMKYKNVKKPIETCAEKVNSIGFESEY